MTAWSCSPDQTTRLRTVYERQIYFIFFKLPYLSSLAYPLHSVIWLFLTSKNEQVLHSVLSYTFTLEGRKLQLGSGHFRWTHCILVLPRRLWVIPSPPSILFKEDTLVFSGSSVYSAHCLTLSWNWHWYSQGRCWHLLRCLGSRVQSRYNMWKRYNCFWGVVFFICPPLSIVSPLLGCLFHTLLLKYCFFLALN